jgi:hypothetical protein
MADNYDELTAMAEDDLEMLPDGWGENDDIFNVDSWSGESSASAAEEEKPASNEIDDAFAEETEDSTTTADEAKEESSPEETEKPTTQTGAKGKLKFSATIDHKTEDVELDETELPTIYQKAHVTDRAQSKLANLQPVIDKATRTAKILGYDTIEEMLDAAEQSYKDGEVERLVNEGTQKDVAEDYVSRKMRDVSTETKAKEPEQDTPKGRDFSAEVKDLLDLRPELKKPGTKLPDEVTAECVKTGKPLSVVYLEWEAKQKQAEYDKLLKENKKLKQNAEAARRAPVRGVSHGGKTEKNTEDDPFLAGFDADD